MLHLSAYRPGQHQGTGQSLPEYKTSSCSTEVIAPFLCSGFREGFRHGFRMKLSRSPECDSYLHGRLGCCDDTRPGDTHPTPSVSAEGDTPALFTFVNHTNIYILFCPKILIRFKSSDNKLKKLHFLNKQTYY